MGARGGNYGKAAAEARGRFLEVDPARILRVCGASAGTVDDYYYYVKFLDLWFRISRADGGVERGVLGGDVWEDANDFESALSVYDYLSLERGERRLCGEWATTEGLGLNTHGGSGVGGGFFRREAEFLGERAGELPDVLTRLGGWAAPRKVGDVSYILPALGALPLWFQFWENDAEFPPSVKLLWDKGTLGFLHYETLYYVINMVFRRVRECCLGA